MNKWKQVAKLFDLNLYEEFNIIGFTESYYFSDDGLNFINANREVHMGDIYVLNGLLCGTIGIVKQPWKPRYNDRYWFYDNTYEQSNRTYWGDNDDDFNRWAIGNCFKTEEEALTKGKSIMAQIVKNYEMNKQVDIFGNLKNKKER